MKNQGYPPSNPNVPPPSSHPVQPTAYDQYGRPLYPHPPAHTPPVAPTPPPNPNEHRAGPHQPQVVYMSRAIDPHEQEPTPEVKAKHEESAKRYPHLNLSEHEYIISAIRRHPIGLISIWSIVVACVLVIFIGFPVMVNSAESFGNGLSASALVSGGLVLLFSAVLFVLGGIIATVVYNANRFYLTNESVIQHIQTSLFSKKDQTISLQNIEDASYRQKGFIQTILNYGAIRLSTEGEETTYRFNYVANPKKQIDLLNNAIEAFKNFRPVDPSDNN